jgi:hypothetical protein
MLPAAIGSADQNESMPVYGLLYLRRTSEEIDDLNTGYRLGWDGNI